MKRQQLLTNGIKITFAILIVIFFVWSLTAGNFQIIFDQPEQFFHLFIQHIQMVVVSSLLALLVAIPVGIFVTRPRFRKLEWLFLNTANLGQTIPSIAILAIVMTYLGIGFNSAVFALFAFSVLPILRNTVAGLNAVDPALIDAAKGMGFTPLQILRKVELPNAAYPIMAGIRTAIVMNIGTAALAYLVGGGGLGDLIFTGIVMQDHTYLLSGAVPVTILAILVDLLLRLFEKVVVSKGLRRAASTSN
ncbi:ABC transporter permease [Desertibacillus haloalkaliphilus]|uniref:ABC transporter permease n=1 Tax=Desertibacillus haloalkaliphilus TaxID=1328930 RepID=UPI001C2670F2|nr:ABC transporter permease [Desertibacillus haloalkaliphilus]MBU8908368.1 ABC transporter permease [Desertibacillus haloalkaliphilus]